MAPKLPTAHASVELTAFTPYRLSFIGAVAACAGTASTAKSTTSANARKPARFIRGRRVHTTVEAAASIDHDELPNARRACSRIRRRRVLSAPGATHRPPLGDRYRASGLWRGETVWDAFSATARRVAGKTAIVEAGRRMEFVALAAAAERLAGGLAARGIGGGDVVAVQLPNWTETLVVMLAVSRLGAVANPVLPIYRRREMGFILRESEARVLFIPGRYRDLDHRVL